MASISPAFRDGGAPSQGAQQTSPIRDASLERSREETLAWLRQQPSLRSGSGEHARGRWSSGSGAVSATEVSTGFARLDALLRGGFPRGGITELEGMGRTSLAMAAVAAATRRGEYVAWVDAANAFDPRSWQATGGHNQQFLWIRPQVAEVNEVELGPVPGESSEERGGRLRRLARRQHRALVRQVFKAAELVLEAGGFSLVVVDLAGGPAGGGRRAAPQGELAWWVRMARKVEHSKAALLVLGEGGGSFNSAVRLRCGRAWAGSGVLGASATGSPWSLEVLTQVEVGVEVVRQRYGAPGQQASLRLGAPVD